MKFLLTILALCAPASAALAASADAEMAAVDAASIQPLLVGSKIPAATLKNAGGESIDLAAAMDGKPTLLVFYRGGWCPICMRHLTEMQKDLAAFEEMGYRTLAISQDTPELIQKTIKKRGVKVELLSDGEMAAARAFGLAFRVDDETVSKYKGYGIDLVGLYGRAEPVMAVPAIFIVSPEGKIRFSYVNPDYRERLSSGLLKAALETYR